MRSIVFRSLRTEYFKKDIDSYWHTLLLVCVARFDTMHSNVIRVHFLATEIGPDKGCRQVLRLAGSLFFLILQFRLFYIRKQYTV